MSKVSIWSVMQSCSKVTWRMNGRPNQMARGLGEGWIEEGHSILCCNNNNNKGEPPFYTTFRAWWKQRKYLFSFFLYYKSNWSSLLFFLQMPNRLISKLLVGGQQANDSYIQECKHNKVFATSDEEEEEED